MTRDLSDLTILEASSRIAGGKLSPVELVMALLGRIEELDARLSSFITITGEFALAQAQVAETEIRQGRYRGPLHGIPFGLKDVYETAGVRTTAHSRVLIDNVPSEDATVVQRLRESGAILLGKLATHEFTYGGVAFDLPWPPARNPWNPEHDPGGSSSGSGAAVAAGLVLGALGTDTGGSIRHPAGFCGIVGLKPTFGRVSRRGVILNSYSFDHCGPMTRTVADCAVLLGVIAGHDPLDDASARAPVLDYQTALSGGVEGMRIGNVRHFFEKDLRASDEVCAAMEEAMRAFANLGAEISEVSLPRLQAFSECKLTIQRPEIYTIHEANLKTRPADYGANFIHRIRAGREARAVDYVTAQAARRELTRAVAAAMADVDVLITAGVLGPAPRIAENAGVSHLDKVEITVPFNVTGYPALSICNGFSAAGLPLAMQIVGKPFDEATVLRAAHAYEQATSWHRVRPTLAADVA